MSKKILVVASNNNGKIKEIKEIFTDYDILSISEMGKKLGKKIIVTENQMTFSENAREKVNCLYQEIGDDYICIGDDSGISIDALDGFPGVHTARWMNADEYNSALVNVNKISKNNNINFNMYDTTTKSEREVSFEIIDVILSDMRRVYIEELDKIFTF